MRRFYTFLFYLALPLIFFRLLWRARKNPGYLKNIKERFGLLNFSIPKGGIWLHAVSVGESLAAVPLIKALQKNYPQLPIIITNTTPTGRDRIRELFKDHKDQIINCYLPYDLPSTLQRFFARVKPRLGIIMETELWPNLFYVCGQQKIPLLIANARLSEKSARGYQRIRSLTKDMMQNITMLAVQTATEAERFVKLGLDRKRITVTGSIKFDLEIPETLANQAQALRSLWGLQRLIWIAASTHESEEEQILTIYPKLRAIFPELLLVLVPRHPDRFARVINLAKRHGHQIVLRSENKQCAQETSIFIGDSMGELLLFYAASDLAFVGGSLIEKGGHNPLEPAALGLPVVMGPHVYNFAAIVDQLQKQQAMMLVQNISQLEMQTILLLKEKVLRQQMGKNGRDFVLKNRGALNKHLAIIENILGK